VTRRALDWLGWLASPALAGAAFCILCLGIVTWLPAPAAVGFALNRWRTDGDTRCSTGSTTSSSRRVSSTRRGCLTGYEQLARRARDRELDVIGATIGPFKGWIRYTEELDHVRNQVNDALRSRRIFDRLVDVDAALRDPTDPARMRPGFSSGDGLHPNAAGAHAIALTL